MRNTIQASALVSAMFVLFSIGAIADTTMTCTRGNTNMQDYPLEVLEDESTCGDNTSCQILMANRNDLKRRNNTQIAIKNSQLASLRAQCDQKFSEQDKQAADQAAAKNKENSDKQNQAMQDMVKSLAGNNNGNNNNNNNGGNNNNGNNNNGSSNGNSEGNSNGNGSSGSGEQASNGGTSNSNDLNDQNDKKGEGNKEAKQGVDGAVQQMVSAPSSNASELNALLQKYNKNRESCISSQGSASEVCLESTSENLVNGVMALNTGVGSASVLASSSGVNNASESAVSGLQTANIALTGFVGACSAANAICKSSCTSAKEALAALKKSGSSANCQQITDAAQKQTCESQVNSAKSKLNEALAKEEKASDKTSIAGKEKICKEKYSKTLANALQGLAQILAALMAAKQNAADSAAANGVIPTVTATADCSDPAKAQTTECLCLLNPRLTGCNNGLAGAASTNGGLSSDPGSLSSLGAGDTSLPNAKNAMELQPLNKDGSGGSAPGGSAGGGAGIGGGSSGFGGQGAKDTAGAAGNKPLDANILAGTSGGGGGGGGWGGFGGGDKYKDYLPGGKRDPASKAAAAAIAAQVSGAGGKSNWEKVKDRYRDNKGTLLNNN